METSLTRTERIIAVSAIGAIAVFFAMFLKMNHSSGAGAQIETDSLINYKMARPEEAYSGYSLEGREVEHTYEALPAKVAKLIEQKKELIAKKTAEDKKKAELAKKQNASAKKSQATVEKHNKQSSPTPAEVATFKAKSSVNNESTSVEAAYYNDQPITSAEKNNSNTKTNKKSYSDWRNLIFSNPNSENLGAFLAAYRKGDLTATEYFTMAQDLVDQTDSKLKALGLMALRAVPSLNSLSQLVHLNAASVASYQAYVNETLNTYLLPENLIYIGQALVTQDKVLIVKSLQLLNLNLVKFSQGDLSALDGPRNKRDGVVTTFSMANYRTLMPALTQLGASLDQELSRLAQQVSSVIQTSNNVAQN